MSESCTIAHFQVRTVNPDPWAHASDHACESRAKKLLQDANCTSDQQQHILTLNSRLGHHRTTKIQGLRQHTFMVSQTLKDGSYKALKTIRSRTLLRTSRRSAAKNAFFNTRVWFHTGFASAAKASARKTSPLPARKSRCIRAHLF